MFPLLRLVHAGDVSTYVSLDEHLCDRHILYRVIVLCMVCGRQGKKQTGRGSRAAGVIVSRAEGKKEGDKRQRERHKRTEVNVTPVSAVGHRSLRMHGRS